MGRIVLLISQTAYPVDQILAAIQDFQETELELSETKTLEEAQELFFQGEVALIITEFGLPGVCDFIRELKQDDAVKHIPALSILPERKIENVKKVLDAGFDSYIEASEIDSLLASHIRPLLRNNQMTGIRMQKISDLQEKAVHDFILLDLVKDYLPRTLWDIAKDFAYQQKIEIPEEKLELTVVFGDLKEFTPLTQHREPSEVIAYLNTAFEVVTRQVYNYAGDIDKFIGDAFLAVFPTADSAVRSMIRVQRELKSLNIERSDAGREPIYFRIGIHTGPVIRGNVGGNKRFDNTLIGDTVNTASRLEQIAPPGGIIISEITRRQMGFSISSELERSVELKGRTGKLKVYDISSLIKPAESRNSVNERRSSQE